jgi:GrpB-like predicted nucleotidyltransferase (UPF0157 family)
MLAESSVRNVVYEMTSIYLAPYDPNWPKHFSLHADRIRDALGERVLLLEHVGSTSVPGRLAARTWKDTQNYADAKSEVVQEILRRALLP